MSEVLVSNFAKPDNYELEDYGKALKSFDYKSPYVNYNQPLNVSETNRLGVLGDSYKLKTFDSSGTGSNLSKAETPWYKDGSAMEGYAGLASSFAQLVALPGQLKLAKLQRKGLQQNLDQAKVDSAFRASTRANLNRPVAKTGGA
jgi:hypothetical protein